METDVFGAAAERELLEGGKNIAVSDNNKVQCVCVYMHACVYVCIHVCVCVCLVTICDWI